MFPLQQVFTSEIRTPLLIAWPLAFAATGVLIVMTGQIYGHEAKNLLTALTSANLYYGSAVAGASATILALVLTLLSLAHGRMEDPPKAMFTRLHAIASFCVYSFIGAVILLLFSSFPFQEFNEEQQMLYKISYYVISAWNGMLAGHMITIILILRDTITFLIGHLSPSYDEEGQETE
jgi:hypothetical protein